jgi:hypothetical protein
MHIIMDGKPEGKKQLRSWEEIMRMDLREIRWEGVEWIHLAQVRTSGGLL